jgi:ABC-2 type transport system ATP-binding protein
LEANPVSVIEIENLTKYYGKTRALEDVDLTVEDGEVFGFIGPNGAGKTTTFPWLVAESPGQNRDRKDAV